MTLARCPPLAENSRLMDLQVPMVLAALCDQLTQAAARYAGTDLILRYEVKPHPGIA
jgi:hypothetical protein